MINENVAPINDGPSVMPVSKPNKKGMKIRRSTFYVLIVVAILGLYGCWHYYGKYKSLTADPNIEAQKMTKNLINTLGKLIELPSDETPSVATISDKEKLVNQPFFKNAENGDILFAYTNSMKAIIYRPSTNKIINVAPISINQPPSIGQGAKQGAQNIQSPAIGQTEKTNTPTPSPSVNVKK